MFLILFLFWFLKTSLPILKFAILSNKHSAIRFVAFVISKLYFIHVPKLLFFFNHQKQFIFKKYKNFWILNKDSTHLFGYCNYIWELHFDRNWLYWSYIRSFRGANGKGTKWDWRVVTRQVLQTLVVDEREDW